MTRVGRRVRVLMLGWEYPPRFAGGLGKACQGLSQAMARAGAQVFFVLPSFPERVSQRHLEVMGAQECLEEAGWEITAVSVPGPSPVTSKTQPSTQSIDQSVDPHSGVIKIPSEAKLFPYSSPSLGPPRDGLRFSGELLRGGSEVEERVHLATRRKAVRLAGRPSASASTSSDLEGESEVKSVNQTPDIYGRDLWAEIEKFCLTVRHLAGTHEVDLIHAHDWMTFPAAFEFQKMTGVPVYLHVHATEYDRSGENLNQNVFRIERDGFRRAHHIFAVSRYTAGIIERLYGIHRSRISVVYNAPEGDRPGLAKKGFTRKPQVVFLGRLTFQKGPDHFLKAAALVAQANKQARFIICGTGDMLEKLRHQAHRLGIESQVHFAGFVDPAGVDEILRTSRVLVMPSVSEPFGLVALEAIQCGIPVILSKQSGVREVLQRALQVDFWDHEKLADQILAALRLPSLSKQLVEDGKDQLRTLSWDKSANLVIDIYRRHLGSIYAQYIEGAHGH